MTTESKRIETAMDIIFCVVFLPLVISLIPLDKWLVTYRSFAVTLLAFLYMLFFTYKAINIPRLFIQKRYLKIAVSMTLILAGVFIISHYPFPPSAENIASKSNRLRIQTVWLLFLVVTGFSFTLELTLELFRQILAKKDIEAAKNKAELSLYKAQINPHFLFNSLNTLYGLVVSKSDRTEDAFVKFTGILRYMYTHTTNETIPIGREEEYIASYIELQSLRLNGHTSVGWRCSIDDPSVQIPPMILITFVENAFKYGSSSSRDCNIDISLSLRDGLMTFAADNDIIGTRSSGHGIGIANCRRRLELLYPGRFTLDTTSDGGRFAVRLTIRLQ